MNDDMNAESSRPRIRSTTILGVRRDGRVLARRALRHAGATRPVFW